MWFNGLTLFFLVLFLFTYSVLNFKWIQTTIFFFFLSILFCQIVELIPRPARACADPPLYLRLRMGKPVGKSMPLPSNVVMSYGKNKLRPEFWFSIPKNRIDELFRFLNTWVPHLYGELDEEAIVKRGYELIQHDTDWVKSGQNKVCSSFNSIEFILTIDTCFCGCKRWLIKLTNEKNRTYN